MDLTTKACKDGKVSPVVFTDFAKPFKGVLYYVPGTG